MIRIIRGWGWSTHVPKLRQILLSLSEGPGSTSPLPAAGVPGCVELQSSSSFPSSSSRSSRVLESPGPSKGPGSGGGDPGASWESLAWGSRYPMALGVEEFRLQQTFSRFSTPSLRSLSSLRQCTEGKEKQCKTDSARKSRAQGRSCADPSRKQGQQTVQRGQERKRGPEAGWWQRQRQCAVQGEQAKCSARWVTDLGTDRKTGKKS